MLIIAFGLTFAEFSTNINNSNIRNGALAAIFWRELAVNPPDICL